MSATGSGWVAIDVVAAAVLALAIFRGLWLGLIRESFSIAALGGAVIAVRLFTDPLALRLQTELALDWSDFALRISAGVLLVVGVLVGVALAGRLLRRGVRAVGLGWADRLGGGVLGTAEGLLVAGLLLMLGMSLVGPDHAMFEESRAVAALDEARRMARDAKPIDVAAPPERP